MASSAAPAARARRAPRAGEKPAPNLALRDGAPEGSIRVRGPGVLVSRADAAQVAGLDVAAWQACIGAPEAAGRVAADVALANSLGIDGTPTFVVNGTLVVGAVPEGDLRAVIEGARASAEASGVPRAAYYDEVVLGR